MIRSIKRPMKRSIIASMIGSLTTASTVSADPVPGFLSNYRFDGNDSSLIPIMSPPLLVGLDLPDLTGSSLNGVDQLFDASADLALLNSIGTSAFSFGGWVKSDALSFGSLFSTSELGIDGSGFKITKTGTAKMQFRMSGIVFTTNANVITGDWVHVFATVVQGGDICWYVNGVLDSDTTTPAYDINGQTAMYYGATSSGSAQFDGSLDGWRLYPFATDAAQVLSLYNNRSWQPSDIITIGWYDPSRESTITSATNLVSQIDDIGSSGIEHLVQATVGNQMSTGLETVNGLNVLSSTVSDRILARAGFFVPPSGNLSISLIAQIDGAEGKTTDSLISMDAATADWQLNAQNTTQFNGQLTSTGLGAGGAVLTGGPFDGVLHLWTIEFNFDNQTLMVYVDGTVRSSTTYTIPLSTSQLFRVFANRSGTQSVFGLLGEVFLTEDVSEATRLKGQTYLANKWGVTI